MPKVTFYPLGNADCYQLDLAGGEKLLIDFADVADPNDQEDRRIALASTLRDDLAAAKRTSYDLVAFTHLDDDHIHGSTDFFYLEHAKKYQDDDRVKIDLLMVPAAAIVEEGLVGEGRIIQQEARHRLKEGKGVRVISRPEKLRGWLAEQNLTLEDRKSLITDAGQLIPEFTRSAHGVEFFAHSPFASRDNGELIDRNTDSIMLQATFVVDEDETKFILGGDVDHEALTRIVEVTEAHRRSERLGWDIFKLPHHCSYLSLSAERGKEKTEPVPKVKWLFEQGRSGGIIVSTSTDIPTTDGDDTQPPHRQAANYYRERTDAISGDFLVTMEHPKSSQPEPLVIEINGSGATVKKRNTPSAMQITSRPGPRAGGV